MDPKLPVHGFVLAGGKSSRMGMDKALLEFRRRPMVEIAVEKLREFCADVGIAGNREDLAKFAEIVPEERLDAGPAAGVEAGLKAVRQEWAIFVPVDVPLVPWKLLRRWAEDGLRRASGKHFGGSYLRTDGIDQPAFCFLPRDSRMLVTRQLDAGERRLRKILGGMEPTKGLNRVVPLDVEELAGVRRPTKLEVEYWFSNVNTPQELAEAEAWAAPEEETEVFRKADRGY